MLYIAECTDTFLPIEDGVGRVVHEYAQSLTTNGQAVYVITPQNTELGYRGGLPFEIVDYAAVRVPVLGSRYGLASLDAHYVARMDRAKVDLVHAHSPGSSGQEAFRLAEKYRVPLIGTFHPKHIDAITRYVKSGALADAAVKLVADFYLRCDEVWTVSKQAAELLRKAGYQGQLEIMPFGTDLTPVTERELQLCRDRFHIGDVPLLVSVGSIDFTKNFDRLIEAAAILAARKVRFQLLIIGTGPDEGRARESVRTKGLSGLVRFLGRVSEDHALRALYRLATVNVYTSVYNTVGLVVHEAASVGTPSIVMRESAVAEPILDGYNGFLSEDTSSALADKLETALATPSQTKEIGENARQSIPVSWESVMQNVLMRYQALANRERRLLKIKRGPFRTERMSVDETLEKRMIDLAGHFLQQDMQNIYAYPNRPFQPNRLPPSTKSNPTLPRSTPEQEGLNAYALRRLIENLNRDPIAQVTNLMIVRHGKVVLDAVWEPYQRELPRQLYSLSKSITSTAIGLLYDEGKLDLDERLTDIFPDKAPKNPQHPVHKLTIRHLLTMSTGSWFNEAGSAIGADWVAEYLNAGVRFEAGTSFSYNSMNTYMLAAIVQKKSGQSMMAYLRPRLLEPLGIYEASWECCPMGIEKGGWGLMLSTESVAKLGLLYLNHGMYEGKRILSEEWVSEATAKQIETLNGEMTYGYGYQIWRGPHKNSYLFNGAFGQYMIALPDIDALVVAFSCTSCLFARGGMMDYIEEALYPSQTLLPAQTGLMNADVALSETLSTLRVMQREPFCPEPCYTGLFRDILPYLNGRVYTLEKNISGIFPVILQSVHNNYALGLTSIAFAEETDGTLCIIFDEGNERNTLRFRENTYTQNTVTVRGETQLVSTNLWALSTSDGWELMLNLHFIETPFTKRIKLRLSGDTLYAVLDESPALKDASLMFLELAGLTKIQILRGLMPMLQKEKLQQQLKTYTTISIVGHL